MYKVAKRGGSHTSPASKQYYKINNTQKCI
jgi:hypothetical protein